MHQYEVGLVGEQRQDTLLDLEELIKVNTLFIQRIYEYVSQLTHCSEEKMSVKKIKKFLKEYLQMYYPNIAINFIFKKVPQSLLEDVKENIIESSVPPMGAYAKLSKSELDSINKKMYTKLSELRRLNTKWDVKVRNSFFLEDITESKSPAEWRTKQSYNPSKFRVLDKLCSPFGN